MLKARFLRYLLWSLALGLTGWTLSQLPVASITESISALGWPQWFAWLGINAVIIGLGTQRWYGLIVMLKAKINFVGLMCIRQAGQAVSFITPGPQFGGEPLQILWLRQRGLPLEKALLSLGLDRLYELGINFSMLLLGVVLLIILPNTPLTGAYHILLGVTLVLVLLAGTTLLLIRQPDWLSGRLKRLAARWAGHPRLQKIKLAWQSLMSDFHLALQTQKSVLIRSTLLSLIGWVALIAELVLLLKFVNVSFDPAGLVLILVAMRLALLLPIPGGVGTLEASVLWSFQSLNLPPSAAIGLIALMRLRDAVILLMGLACLRWVGKKSQFVDATSTTIVAKPTFSDLG